MFHANCSKLFGHGFSSEKNIVSSNCVSGELQLFPAINILFEIFFYFDLFARFQLKECFIFVSTLD